MNPRTLSPELSTLSTRPLRPAILLLLHDRQDVRQPQPEELGDPARVEVTLTFGLVQDLPLLAQAHGPEIFPGYFRFPDDERSAPRFGRLRIGLVRQISGLQLKLVHRFRRSAWQEPVSLTTEASFLDDQQNFVAFRTRTKFDSHKNGENSSL